jgi:hypothetical protein
LFQTLEQNAFGIYTSILIEHTNQTSTFNPAAPMKSLNPNISEPIHAGVFSSWLRRTRRTLIKEDGVDVPCGSCTGCCCSSKFIHIRPEEKEALSQIPKKLLSPAPLLPKGNMILGYNEKGACPMFIDRKCSIYAHRPIACRNFDCRVFCAAGIEADDDDKKFINNQIVRWQFSYPYKRDLDLHLAVRNAAKFITDHPECFPGGKVPARTSQLAVVAIKVYTVFQNLYDESKKSSKTYSNKEIADMIIEANEDFESFFVKTE